MPTQIRFDGTAFTVLDAIYGKTVETGHTPADIARRMMEKYAKEHPYYPNNVYNDYYNVIMDSANIAMAHPNEDIAIYDRKNAPAPTTSPPKQPTPASNTKPDNSIVFFKTLLNYKPMSLQNGEKGLSASIGSYATFVVTQRGSRYHTDVFYQGKKIIIGNYNLKDWAMYEGPYFWWQKNIGTIADIPKLLASPVKPEHEAKGVPIGYEGWEQMSENLWVKNMPAYQLIVQFYNGLYSSTVKDIKHFRVYFDAAHFATLKEAMNAATTRAVKLASQETTANGNIQQSTPQKTGLIDVSSFPSVDAALNDVVMNVQSLTSGISDLKLRSLFGEIGNRLRDAWSNKEISLSEVEAMKRRLEGINHITLIANERKAVDILNGLLDKLRKTTYTGLQEMQNKIRELKETRNKYTSQSKLF